MTGNNPDRAWLGIDFSGNWRMWRRSQNRSNVYVAEISCCDEQLFLNGLQTVQDLSGEDDPFDKLIFRLAKKDFTAAAIDAPFSIPFPYLPVGGYRALLANTAAIARTHGRPFPRGIDFVTGVLKDRQLKAKKPLRDTEAFWRKRVNVRSTLWCGPRGGTAMTVACLCLLAKSQCPIWPWQQFQPETSGLLVEAFPAAQLVQWGLPHDGYNGSSPGAIARRTQIVTALSEKLEISLSLRELMVGSADALDAVLCCLAAIAVTTSRVFPSPDMIGDEGQIAVHE